MNDVPGNLELKKMPDTLKAWVTRIPAQLEALASPLEEILVDVGINSDSDKLPSHPGDVTVTNRHGESYDLDDLFLKYHHPELGQGTFRPFTVSGWLTMRALCSTPGTTTLVGDPDGRVANWMAGVHAWRANMRDRADQQPTPEPRVLASFLSMEMVDNIGVVDLPPGMSYDGLSRVLAASKCRNQLSSIQDNIPSGMEMPATTAAALIKCGLDHPEVRPQREIDMILGDDHKLLSGLDVRAAVITDPADTMGATTQKLSDDLFSDLTSTPVASLEVQAMNSSGGWSGIIDRLEVRAEQVEGELVEEVTSRICARLTDAFGGSYRPETSLYETSDGTDVLLVRDDLIKGGYIYTWPSAERRPLVDLQAGTTTTTFDASRVPSREEICALTDAITDYQDRYIQYMAADEAAPDDDVELTGPSLTIH